MIGISTWIIAGGAIVSAIATGFIAWYAVANHRLANAIKSANEQHQQETNENQQKMNEILKSVSRAIAYLAGSESRKEAQKELKEQEAKQQRRFNTQGR